MTRVIAYIDGFNLFHSIDELNDRTLKWLNLWSLSASLIKADQELVEVNYFSAYATWMPEKYKIHRDYTRALQHVGVRLVLGHFKTKFLTCRKCGRQYETKEEKETDVNIALRLVTDGLLDRYDTALLITADTDLKPAIDTARFHRPQKKIIVVAPPGRMSRSRSLTPTYELKPGRLANHLLAASYHDAAGKVIVTRPEKWRP